MLYLYSHTLQYTLRAICVRSMCRVSESLLDSTTWYHMCILTPYSTHSGPSLFAGICRVSESRLDSTTWYCMYILTPYSTHSGPSAFAGICKVSESLLDSTTWYRIYFLTPYSTLPGPSAFAGTCRVSESRLDSTTWYHICILTPYSTHSRPSVSAGMWLGVRKSDGLYSMASYLYSHTLHICMSRPFFADSEVVSAEYSSERFFFQEILFK